MSKRQQLSQQALDILNKRYFKPGEDWGDMCNRVASFLADNNVQQLNEFYDVMVRGLFLPNTPCLINAGTEHPQLSACISGDTLIYTRENGLIPMKDIKVDMHVLTHKRRFKRVLHHWSNGIKNTLNLGRGTAKKKEFSMTCTPDHKILSQADCWVSASDISCDMIPSLWQDGPDFPEKIQLTTEGDIAKGKQVCIDDNTIFLKNRDPDRSGTYDKQENFIKTEINNDKQIAWLLGMYIAQGNLDGYTIRFTLNANDTEIGLKIKNILQEYFGLQSSMKFSNHGNWLNIRASSRWLCKLLTDLIGYGFANKRLPSWICHSPDEYKQSLLQGIMDGDGHDNKLLVLANPTLAYEVTLLSRSIGNITSITFDKRHKLSKNPTAGMQICKSDYTYNLKKKTGDSVEVFDMEVEDDHSFVAGDFYVHNCFYLPIEDNMHSIFQTLHDAAHVFKSGGGVGFNFSSLRPEGDIVKTTNGVSSGPVSFMKVYDAAIEQIKQGGVRRGAAMSLMSVEHPDIVKFIRCKSQDGDISNFNISVAITDEFMRVLQSDNRYQTWICKFGDKEYILEKNTAKPEHDGMWWEASHRFDDDDVTFYSVNDIWNLIVHHSWMNGEPGIVFWDHLRKDDKTIEGTNPCSELPLERYGSCCLGSIDVSKCFKNGHVDMTLLSYTVRVAVEMLNAIVDKGEFPLQQIKDTSLKTRRIGLGVMGWADLLLKKKIRYGSDESCHLARTIMQQIHQTAMEHSQELDYNNTTFTAIAPTGSLSILAGCSSGIEPNFAWVTKHTRQDFGEHIVVHKLAEEYLNDQGEPVNMPDYFVTTNDITPQEHVDMQAAFQSQIDSAVSKTVNLPNSADETEVNDILRYAWEEGCKGITVYRDGSRQGQVLSKVSDKQKVSEEFDETCESLTWETLTEQLGLPKDRPYLLDGYTFKIPIDMGNGKVENVYLTVNVHNNHPYEIFLNGNIKEAAPATAQHIDSTTRLVSLALRGGTPLNMVIEQLEKVPCSHIFSIPYKIVLVLKEFLAPNDHEPCPECNGKIVFSEGCQKCEQCGWAKCG